jgi:ribulose-phosphate 3-epimerase
MVQIIPAVLAPTEEVYKYQNSKIAASPSFQEGWIQIDLMDNKFVPNKSIEPEVVVKYPTNLKKEFQLMVVDPSKWVKRLVNLGALRIIAPVEVDKAEIDQFLQEVKKYKIASGLSVNPDTAIESIEPYVGTIDYALVMGVTPGFQGQAFQEVALEKIKAIRKKGWQIKIGVDGGVKVDNAKKLVDAGVDYLAIGSGLLKGDIDENLELIWEAIQY